MPIINQHREEIPVERDHVNMKSGERYCRVFQKTARRAGSVEKSWHKLGRLAEIYAGGRENLLHFTVQWRKDDQLHT